MDQDLNRKRLEYDAGVVHSYLDCARARLCASVIDITDSSNRHNFPELPPTTQSLLT